VTSIRVVLTVAALTVQEAARRRVLWALAGMTVVLLALSAWGFSKLGGYESQFGSLTSGEARLVAAQVLNLVMFGLSLIAALGTAFLAGPTLAGETESGIALSVLARPIRRSAFLLGKWLGLVGFGTGFVVLAGLAQCLVVRVTVDYWPPEPATALAEQLGEGAGRRDPALVEDDDPVAHPLDLADEVRVEEDGDSASLQRQQDVPDIGPAEGVQGAGRLVEHDQLGPGHQRDRQPEALLHALGEAAHPVVGAVNQADQTQALPLLLG